MARADYDRRPQRAITDDLRVRMKEIGKREMGVEGVADGRWVLQDFADIVVHVFLAETRSLYDLDGLWMDAKRVRVPGQV